MHPPMFHVKQGNTVRDGFPVPPVRTLPGGSKPPPYGFYPTYGGIVGEGLCPLPFSRLPQTYGDTVGVDAYIRPSIP